MTVRKASDGGNVLMVEVILGRRLLSIVLTCYIPTILLNVISHSTNYFRPDLFDTTVEVNLTTMLVLTTLFISVSKFTFGMFILVHLSNS